MARHGSNGRIVTRRCLPHHPIDAVPPAQLALPVRGGKASDGFRRRRGDPVRADRHGRRRHADPAGRPQRADPPHGQGADRRARSLAHRRCRRGRRRSRREGRAFSAGGDILHVYEAGAPASPPFDFFADEYRLNAAIARYPKPYVALIDGIVMGGGVGVSFHGSHRVLTENAEFAMPEVGIGFFPDVGGSHLLPDLGGSFGMYLGLTGNRIGYGDALWSGLATHTMKAEYQGGLLERLAETGDAGSGAARGVRRRPGARPTRPTLEAIAQHFSKPSLGRHRAQPRSRRRRPTNSRPRRWRRMRTRSPTSLARRLPPDQRRPDAVDGRVHAHGVPHPATACSRARISTRASAPSIIDKGDTPRWDPPTLEEVDHAAIDALFRAARRRGTRAVSVGEISSGPSSRRRWRSSSPGSTG